jgi:nucleoside-diphosphate-sugar epimerase
MTEKRIIIVGASGLIGSAVEAAARKAGHEVVGTCATRPREALIPFDVTKQSLSDVVPDLGADDRVLLMSALIDQGWVQAHPGESHTVNYIGAVEVASAALARGAHLVFMSTEAVFAGGASKDGFDEAATPEPLSLYALQKVKVEQRLPLREACIVRTGSVVGWSAGDGRDAVSNTYAALLKPGAKMAHDNVLTITDVDDLAAGLLRVAERRAVGIVHLAGGAVARTQLADWIVAASRHGKRMRYKRVALSSLPDVKATRAGLASKRAVELGLTFAEPRSVVERKVAVLDQEE